MMLDKFEAELANLIGRATDLRPFICEGSPLDCPIFLVGFNPATSMVSDFWTFWRKPYGYDKKAWFQQYLAEREMKPLKPGRIRRQRISATRRNIEAFVDGAGSIPVLETNIYAKASDDMKSLNLSSREIAPFRYLLRTISPKVIVVHGKPAVAAIASFGIEAKIIEADYHFSRRTSKKTAYSYGRQAALEASR